MRWPARWGAVLAAALLATGCSDAHGVGASGGDGGPDGWGGEDADVRPPWSDEEDRTSAPLPDGSTLSMEVLGSRVLRPGERRRVRLRVTRRGRPVAGTRLRAELDYLEALTPRIADLDPWSVETGAGGEAELSVVARNEGWFSLLVRASRSGDGGFYDSEPVRASFRVQAEGEGRIEARIELDPALPTEHLVAVDVELRVGPRDDAHPVCATYGPRAVARVQLPVEGGTVRFGPLPSGVAWVLWASPRTEARTRFATGCVEGVRLAPGETRRLRVRVPPPSSVQWDHYYSLWVQCDPWEAESEAWSRLADQMADGLAGELAGALLQRLDPDAAAPSLLGALRARAVERLRAEGADEEARLLAARSAEPGWEDAVGAAWSEVLRGPPEPRTLLRRALGECYDVFDEWAVTTGTDGLSGVLSSPWEGASDGTWRAERFDGVGLDGFQVRAGWRGLPRALLRAQPGWPPAGAGPWFACGFLAAWMAEHDAQLTPARRRALWQGACDALASDWSRELLALLRERGLLELRVETGPTRFQVEARAPDQPGGAALIVGGSAESPTFRWWSSEGRPLPWMPATGMGLAYYTRAIGP